MLSRSSVDEIIRNLPTYITIVGNWKGIAYCKQQYVYKQYQTLEYHILRVFLIFNYLQKATTIKQVVVAVAPPSAPGLIRRVSDIGHADSRPAF